MGPGRAKRWFAGVPPSGGAPSPRKARHRWRGSTWQVRRALGGKLARSLRSLRPIAAASVVAGPREFAEGAWIHRRGGTATAHGPAPRRGFDHTQDRASPGGWTTPRAGHPQGGWTTPLGPGVPRVVGAHP